MGTIIVISPAVRYQQREDFTRHSTGSASTAVAAAALLRGVKESVVSLGCAGQQSTVGTALLAVLQAVKPVCKDLPAVLASAGAEPGGVAAVTSAGHSHVSRMSTSPTASSAASSRACTSSCNVVLA